MGRAAHGLLKTSDLRVMPGCGHAPYFEDPDTFVGVVAAFFADTGAQSAISRRCVMTDKWLLIENGTVIDGDANPAVSDCAVLVL